MSSLEFLHPKHWKPAIGYSNGVAAKGRMVFTGGMIGWNADCVFETDDFAGQTAQALRNIVEPCWPKPGQGPNIWSG
jgi:enamine deaminase RidA (YjgF/YER057c/UK114 family)